MVIEIEKLIASVIFVVVGLLFFFNNKNISKGAFKFYKTLYTAKNLRVIFKAAGILLIIGAIILILFK